MEFKNKSFVFYRAFYDATKHLPDFIRVRCYDALISYCLNGTYKSDDLIVNALMTSFIAYIDLMKR